jgi:hypothetical protein
MDSLITAAARALAAGDPLGALKRIALRGDAPALALRGIAMAQLGDLVRAKALLRSAARAFGKMSRSCAESVWLGRESYRWFPPRRLTQSASPSNPPLVAEKSRKNRTRKVRAAALRLVYAIAKSGQPDFCSGPVL